MVIFLTTIFILALLAGYQAFKLRQLRKRLSQKQAQSEDLQSEKRAVFDFLHDLGDVFSDQIDRRHLLDTILSCCLKVTRAQSGIIYLKIGAEDLIAESVQGYFPPLVPMPEDAARKALARQEYLHTFLRNHPIHIKDTLISAITSTCLDGQAVFIPEAENDSRLPTLPYPEMKAKSFLAVPLQYRGRILGIMALSRQGPKTPHFTETEFEIAQSMAMQASFSLYNATAYLQLAEKQRLDKDLETASEIQQILLPQTSPLINGYDLASVNRPAQRVSGDYYDFLNIDENHLGIVVADVSGKGVPASLIMAMCRTVMRTQAAGIHSAAEVLKKVNRILYPDIRNDMFITMAYMILDIPTGKLTIARAGHCIPLVYKSDFGSVETIQSPGMALGIDSGEVFDTLLQDVVISLDSLDTVLLYTDGVSEAIDADGQEFGFDQVKSTLQNFASQGVKFLVNELVERVRHFSGGELQHDDVTLVALQKK